MWLLPRCQGVISILDIDHLLYHSWWPREVGATIIGHFIGIGAERLLNNAASVTELAGDKAAKVARLQSLYVYLCSSVPSPTGPHRSLVSKRPCTNLGNFTLWWVYLIEMENSGSVQCPNIKLTNTSRPERTHTIQFRKLISLDPSKQQVLWFPPYFGALFIKINIYYS